MEYYFGVKPLFGAFAIFVFQQLGRTLNIYLSKHTMSNIPDWALAYKGPSQEVKVIKGRCYLYSISSTYIKGEKHKRRKKSVYLGTLVEGVGLVPKGTRMERLRQASANAGVELQDHESFGVGSTLPVLMGREVSVLSTRFDDIWQSVLAVAYCRLVFHCPLEDMEEHWRRSYLSLVLPEAAVSKDALYSLLRTVGERSSSRVGFMTDLMSTGSEYIVFDATDIYPESSKMFPAKLRKTWEGGREEIFNMMIVFSVTENMPGFYKLFRGNMKDVKSFAATMREAGYKNVVVMWPARASSANTTWRTLTVPK